MSADTALPEEDDLLAAELALNLLETTDRPAAASRLADDVPFRAAYARWQDLAAAMIGTHEETPRPSVWTAIQARLPANEQVTAKRSNVRWWQASTAVASIAAVTLGAIALRPPPPPIIVAPPRPAPAAPALVAVLVGDKDNGAIAVSYDRTNDRLILTPTRLSIGKRDAELWVIGTEVGAKPRSLGIIPATEIAKRSPHGELARQIVAGATLAVSAEPIGGSTTGQPTGPVLYLGKVSAT